MLLERDERVGLSRCPQHGVDVERLDRMNAQHARGDSRPAEHVRRGKRGCQQPTGGQDRDVPAVAHRDGTSKREFRERLVDSRLARASEAQVAGPWQSRHGPSGELRLDRIVRRDHRHRRQRPHERDVLGCVVRIAQRAVGEPPANRHDLDRRVVVAHIVSDLLEAAHDRKVCDRVGENRFAAERHSGGEAGHVLLGHPRVDELGGQRLTEALDDAEPEIADDQHDARIAPRQLDERLYERGPHDGFCNSFRAAAYSSPCGDR